MKKLFVFAPILILLFLFSCTTPEAEPAETTEIAEQSFDEPAAREAIMRVIEGETKCFFERNYACWKENWIHEKYAFQAWNNADGTYGAAVGWDKINTQGKEYIANVPEGKTKTSHPIVKRENLQFKFYNDNLAYLLWKQYNSDRANEFYSVSQETRLMELRDGQWKIVNMSAFWDNVNKIPFNDVDID